MCPVALKVKMSDRAWMYTGHTGQNKWSAEWFTKTKGFVQAAFANGQRKTWCPCFRCGNWEKRTEAEMGKHLQKIGFEPDYTVWTFHGESAQRDRAEVDRRRTDEHGTSRGIILSTPGLTKHAYGICLTSKTSFAHTTST